MPLHVDKGDLRMGFITWFLNGKKKGSSLGGDFILPEYEYFFKPKNGIV
jgi:hypothetical protein